MKMERIEGISFDENFVNYVKQFSSKCKLSLPTDVKGQKKNKNKKQIAYETALGQR